MEEIHKANSSQSLGIITGFSYEEIRRQVLLKSATVAIKGSNVNDRLDVLATEPGGWSQRNRQHTIIGKQTPRRYISRSISRGASVVNIISHSDGIDASLGGDLLL